MLQRNTGLREGFTVPQRLASEACSIFSLKDYTILTLFCIFWDSKWFQDGFRFSSEIKTTDRASVLSKVMIYKMNEHWHRLQTSCIGKGPLKEKPKQQVSAHLIQEIIHQRDVYSAGFPMAYTMEKLFNPDSCNVSQQSQRQNNSVWSNKATLISRHFFFHLLWWKYTSRELSAFHNSLHTLTTLWLALRVSDPVFSWPQIFEHQDPSFLQLHCYWRSCEAQV